ncbi:MAG TPA: ferritin-like domain-containing protein [Chitinophagaceae bacterium]|nr:ferritin-like domain-containing protein [Chitinophagaceae bacterium]
MPTTKTRSSARTRRERSAGGSRTQSSKKTSYKSSKKTSKSENGMENGKSQLEKLFTDSLKDIYWAEKHLTRTLAKMRKAATTEELASAIEEHLAQTEEHITRLEQVFEICGKKAQAKKCEAMVGLVKEGEHAIKETENDSMTRDAGIIMSAQKVEHYEIATYGTLVQFARTLGMDDAVELLEQTLEEEKDTDQKLTQLAEANINREAEEEKEDDEEEDEEEDDEDTEEETEEEK